MYWPNRVGSSIRNIVVSAPGHPPCALPCLQSRCNSRTSRNPLSPEKEHAAPRGKCRDRSALPPPSPALLTPSSPNTPFAGRWSVGVPEIIGVWTRMRPCTSKYGRVPSRKSERGSVWLES